MRSGFVLKSGLNRYHLIPKSVLQHHSSKASILRHSAFLTVQLSHPYMTTGKTIALTIWTFVGKVMSLLFNTLFRFVIAWLPRSKHLLISWLQSLHLLASHSPIPFANCNLLTRSVSPFHFSLGTHYNICLPEGIKKHIDGMSTQRKVKWTYTPGKQITVSKGYWWVRGQKVKALQPWN